MKKQKSTATTIVATLTSPYRNYLLRQIFLNPSIQRMGKQICPSGVSSFVVVVEKLRREKIPSKGKMDLAWSLVEMKEPKGSLPDMDQVESLMSFLYLLEPPKEEKKEKEETR